MVILLPRLLDRMDVLAAALLTGGVWIVWHIPAFFLPGVMSADDFLWWALGTAALSLVMGVLYLRANANLLVAGIIPHLAINATARAGCGNPAHARYCCWRFLLWVFGDCAVGASGQSRPKHHHQSDDGDGPNGGAQ